MKTVHLWVLIALLLPAHRIQAFSLLGPFEPWMSETNGFYPGSRDIGGPMDITNGFRWNVPVVTYGFDQSFIDFFGTNGVAAVESVIQILNDLPPSSQLNLTNYPFNTQRPNFISMSVCEADLKSWTLALLLEQMGLTQPTRSIFVMRLWDSRFLNYLERADYTWPPGIIGSNILMRNFDPETLTQSAYVNGTFYGGIVIPTSTESGYVGIYFADVAADTYTAVADQNLQPGIYYTGLSRDDVGGLAYLLSTNNVKYENLLPDVHPVDTNSSSVNGAWRPGVDKVTFVHQPVGMLKNSIGPLTIQFIDRYLSNGTVLEQSVARITTQPDILFRADFLGRQAFSRTGTTNWINNATPNGNTNGTGPGVIQPPINIVFGKLGRSYSMYSEGQLYGGQNVWGTFDGSTNSPTTYPAPQTGSIQSIVQLWVPFASGDGRLSNDWNIIGSAGDQFIFQSSSNLADWTNLFFVTNNNSIWSHGDFEEPAKSKFYRLIPQ